MTSGEFNVPSADAIKAMVNSHEYNGARAAVLMAARQGRATYLPAGARNNDTARVLVDTEEVGQASVLMHYVREEFSGTMFGERRLVEGYDWQVPDSLKG